MLEVSPLPFGLEPVLQRLRGLPTFYLTPFAAAPPDDTLVTLDQILAAGGGEGSSGESGPMARSKPGPAMGVALYALTSPFGPDAPYSSGSST
jgi:hypothetical protein